MRGQGIIHGESNPFLDCGAYFRPCRLRGGVDGHECLGPFVCIDGQPAGRQFNQGKMDLLVLQDVGAVLAGIAGFHQEQPGIMMASKVILSMPPM